MDNDYNSLDCLLWKYDESTYVESSSRHLHMPLIVFCYKWRKPHCQTHTSSKIQTDPPLTSRCLTRKKEVTQHTLCWRKTWHARDHFEFLCITWCYSQTDLGKNMQWELKCIRERGCFWISKFPPEMNLEKHKTRFPCDAKSNNCLVCWTWKTICGIIV